MSVFVCRMHLFIRALAWLNRKMGITASLGYGPGARLPFATDWGHADHAGQEATDGTDEIEVVSVLHATGLTPAGAEIAGKARVDAGLSSLQGVAADAAWVEGVTRQATRADAGVVGGGEARTAAVAAVAGSEGSAAAAAEFGLAAPLDEEQLAHLQVRCSSSTALCLFLVYVLHKRSSELGSPYRHTADSEAFHVRHAISPRRKPGWVCWAHEWSRALSKSALSSVLGHENTGML